MTTVDFITTLFCRVNDRMCGVAKHAQALLYPSELVTIGILYALKDSGAAILNLAQFDPRMNSLAARKSRLEADLGYQPPISNRRKLKLRIADSGAGD